MLIIYIYIYIYIYIVPKRRDWANKNRIFPTSFNHGLSLGAKIAYQHILLFSNLMFVFLLLWRCSVITFSFTQGLLRDICTKNAEILGLGKLSSALNPSGLSVFNSCIHISLRLFNLNVSISLSTQSLSNSI